MSPVSVLAWPILERIPIVGDLAVSPHGISTAAGFLVGALLMLRRVELRGLGHTYVEDVREQVQDLLFRAAVGALIGMRVAYVATHPGEFADDPLSVLYVWQGGLSFLGGVAGALIASLPVARRRGFRGLMLLDSAAPGLVVGAFIGRIGDLAIGEHLGPPASGFPFAWRCTGNWWEAATNSIAYTPPEPYPYQAAELPIQGCFDVAVHHTALYDFASNGLLLVVLLLLERRPRWDGFFITVTLYWYGAVRFLNDFVREGENRFLGLTGSQYAILGTMAVFAAVLAVLKPWRQRPWSWTPPDFDHPWKRPPDDDPSPADDATRGRTGS